MPPDSPPLTRTNRFDPIRTRLDVLNTRSDAMPTGRDMTNPTTARTAKDTIQRPENLLMHELWKHIVSNNSLENGDVRVPANLVQIMLALVISMQETTLRLNALETQIQVSRDSTTRLERLERQLNALVGERSTNRSPQPAVNNLPAKPKTWATAAAEGLKITSSRAPPPPHHHRIK